MVFEKVMYISSTDFVKGSKSKLAQSESNDCVVRAIAAAFDEEYGVVHKVVEKNCDRKPRRGVMSDKFMNMFREYEAEGLYLFGKKFRVMSKSEIKNIYGKKADGSPNERKMTTQSFIKKYTTGNYLVLVKYHTFVIKDSTIVGNREDAEQLRSRILFAVEVLD